MKGEAGTRRGGGERCKAVLGTRARSSPWTLPCGIRSDRTKARDGVIGCSSDQSMSLSTQAAERPLELQPWFSGTSFLVIVRYILPSIVVKWRRLTISLRLGLFATCRKFIDRSLYNGLKQISQSPHAETSIELDALPPPSAHSTPERRSTNDTSHSLLSKTLFSLCFSESCTLFLLLMCQALDVFNTRYVEFLIPKGPFSSVCSVRLLNWQISLYAVLLNIIILIPLSLCLVSTTSSNSCESYDYMCPLRGHIDFLHS